MSLQWKTRAASTRPPTGFPPSGRPTANRCWTFCRKFTWVRGFVRCRQGKLLREKTAPMKTTSITQQNNKQQDTKHACTHTHRFIFIHSSYLPFPSPKELIRVGMREVITLIMRHYTLSSLCRSEGPCAGREWERRVQGSGHRGRTGTSSLQNIKVWRVLETSSAR